MSDKDNHLTLTTSFDELEDKMLSEKNIDDLKNIMNLFNLNIQKQEILRNKTLLNLEELTLSEMSERLNKKSDEFSNDDLLKYYKVIKETLLKSPTSLDNIPTIQINQNNLNVNVADQTLLSKESRDRIADVVKNILKTNKTQQSNTTDVVVDTEIEDLEKTDE